MRATECDYEHEEPTILEKLADWFGEHKKTIGITTGLGLISLPALGAYLGWKKAPHSKIMASLTASLAGIVFASTALNFGVKDITTEKVAEYSTEHTSITQTIEHNAVGVEPRGLEALAFITTNIPTFKYLITQPDNKVTNIEIKVYDGDLEVTGKYAFDGHPELAQLELPEDGLFRNAGNYIHGEAARALYHDLCKERLKKDKALILFPDHLTNF